VMKHGGIVLISDSVQFTTRARIRRSRQPPEMSCFPCAPIRQGRAARAPAEVKLELSAATADSVSVSELLARHREVIEATRTIVNSLEGYDASLHDDIFLLRFLLSHKMNTKAAVKAFGTALKWRRENGIDMVAAEIRAGMQQHEFPGYTHIHPHAQMYFVNPTGQQPYMFASAAGLRFGDLMTAVRPAEYVRYTHYVNEWTFQQCDAATRKLDRFIKVVRVVDSTGLGWAHAHLGFFRVVAAANKGSEDAYPQLLGAFFLCNAGVTMKRLWESTLRPLLPSRMVDKSQVLRPLQTQEDLDVLLRWIPRESLPTQVGGSLRIADEYGRGRGKRGPGDPNHT